jgi:hypothetical protein
MKPELFNPPINDYNFVNLWRYIQESYSVKDIDSLYYNGIIAGSEFVTYNASKLYLIDELLCFSNSNTLGTYPCGYIDVFLDNGATVNRVLNVLPVWDVVAAGAKFQANYLEIKRVVATYITPNSYTNMKFNGYKIILN